VQRAWLLEHLAVTVTRIDFVDPALADQPDVRERGVRIEVRPVESTRHGSGYSSPALDLAPATCRIDLLESRADAADRMHWHPTMSSSGEPGDRVLDGALTADPLGWLRLQLLDVVPAPVAADVVDAVAVGLAAVRSGSWGGVVHDVHGLAELD